MHRKWLEWYTLIGRNVVGSVKKDNTFLYLYIIWISKKHGFMWHVYNLFILHIPEQQQKAEHRWFQLKNKKKLCIHAGGVQFYPGSRKGTGWCCTQMWAGTIVGCPCNMTSSMAEKRRYYTGDPLFGLSEAQWRILLESEMKRNKMSLSKLNLNINTNWIREERWDDT